MCISMSEKEGSAMMLMEERRGKIMQELVSMGSVHVSQRAEQFNVTSETIRKDLAYLEEQGLLVKTHGGATLKQGAIELSFGVREQENAAAKAVIARTAVELTPEGSSVIVCTGSTTLEVAKLLSLRNGLKIFTDSLPVALCLLQSDNQVFMFGGQLREQSSSVFGGWTIEQIRQVEADVCFMGTDGFMNIDGPATPSPSDCFIDREILAHSESRYVLADATKFRRKSLYKICDWKDVTALITNADADSELVERLRQKTEVICC